MPYEIYYYPDARDALARLSPDVAKRITSKIYRLRNGLVGDVKRLKSFVPEYRLRVGDWRVLFEVDGQKVIIHDIRHRANAYDG